MGPDSKILLINPWVHDFAASDYWAKPLGLLFIADFLRQNGFNNLDFIDCLNYLPDISELSEEYNYPKVQKFGKSDYLKKIIEKPDIFKNYQRFYRHYGIDEKLLNDLLDKRGISPDLILLTSMGTYWYKPCIDIIRFLKAKYPSAKIALGGVYATLCHEHAVKNSEADYIVKGDALLFLSDYLKIEHFHGKSYYPAFDLIENMRYLPVLTSRGCPFDCYYCASRTIDPEFSRYPLSIAYKNIKNYYEKGIRDFVFYDDALFFEPKEGILPLLEQIIKDNLQLRLHTPNGVHVRYIDPYLAEMLYKSGFQSLRLGFESSEEKYRPYNSYKTTLSELIEKINLLKTAGFKRDQMGIYILIGLPDQTVLEVKNTIQFLKPLEVNIHLNEYSPIPHTYLFLKYFKNTKIEEEPLWQNNSVLAIRSEVFNFTIINELKKMVQ